MPAAALNEHYAKCKSVPASVKEWAVEKLGRSADKRKGEGAVKQMEGMFDDIAKESDQTLITDSLNSNKCATGLCDEATSHFITTTCAVERYNTSPRTLRVIGESNLQRDLATALATHPPIFLDGCLGVSY
jgi:hypothetical protein